MPKQSQDHASKLQEQAAELKAQKHCLGWLAVLQHTSPMMQKDDTWQNLHGIPAVWLAVICNNFHHLHYFSLLLSICQFTGHFYHILQSTCNQLQGEGIKLVWFCLHRSTVNCTLTLIQKQETDWVEFLFIL